MRLTPRSAVLFLLAMTLIPITQLAALKWGTYTNTNNVTDVVMTDTRIYTATWGGVVEYDKSNPATDCVFCPEYIRTITSVDGLVSNDIRTLAYEADTGDIWAGSANDGITIIKPSGMQNLDDTSGLPSNKVRRILSHDNYIYVATDQGISQFYYLPGVYFPLLLHQYNEASTQGGLVSNDINDITVSDNGYLFCATSEGISFVHTDSLDIDAAWHKWIYSNSPLPDLPILSISASSDYIALNSMTSVHRHSVNPFTDDWQSWTRVNGLQDSVFTVIIHPTNYINVAYGVWDEDTMNLMRKNQYSFCYIDSSGVVNPAPGEPFDLADLYDLPEACVYRFSFPDEDMSVFATWGEGIYFYYGWQTHRLFNNCIGFQTVSEIETDPNHNIWIGSGWLGGTMTKKGTRGFSEWSDGQWINYTVGNSPLPSDNIKNVAVDQNGRKWFGSWYVSGDWSPGAYSYDDETDDWLWYTSAGVRHYVEGTGWSAAQPGSPPLFNNTIAEIATDLNGNILISCSGDGIIVLDQDYNRIGDFLMPAAYSVFQSTSYIYHSGTRYFFGLRVDDRLIIWNDDSLPNNDTDHWLYPPPSELNNCSVYGVVTIYNIFGEEENWIATSRGLFMWNGENWYKYGRDIKARIWKNNAWSQSPNDGAILYYVDEERLFASAETTPTAIFKDPFGRIWIGSLENGFTMYDPDTERFTNYYKGKSPLLSNYITCFGYDPILGKLLIGTPDGLNTLEIGIEIKTEKHLNTVKAFPNPFFPDKDDAVRIVNLPSLSMPKGTNVCKIYDSSGQLVIELKENLFARFDWDGLNQNRKKCSSGIYFFVVTSANGETQRGKFALIR